jgi:hypothetical protein
LLQLQQKASREGPTRVQALLLVLEILGKVAVILAALAALAKTILG